MNWQIGHTHGSQASALVKSSIDFYAGLFQKTAGIGWDTVKAIALEYEPNIRTKWPDFLEEMQGIADAVGVELSEILALNVRTEITFGMFSDGCTSLAWTTPTTTILSQNWDWMEEQKPNIVLLCIEQQGLPSIKMLTEAGLIGKIGLNSSGVGACVNAIRAKGADPTRLPMHLAMRTALNSASLEQAVSTLERYGVASSCHILLADKTGAVGTEWSHVGHKSVPQKYGRIQHSNHMLLDQPGVVDTVWLPDSLVRVRRMEELADAVTAPTVAAIQNLYKDETGSPGAICRKQEGYSTAATLFNIVMDLAAVEAHVIMGRPTEPEETLLLSF
ncbi:acyl-coenzyme A:6-aminopenicillanic acid acyl-transferase-domain-containing protein [Hypoxylon crocopeplum]|nr:acyl-coenzyme A:6-aminopenicillanic acid acyl-transferase-domain-containing protein [Hypoxylon crocopeplum]